MDHVDGYYGEAFRGFRGLTQGDPLSLTIFNMAVEEVVSAQMFLSDGGARGRPGWVREGGDSPCRLILCG